MNQFDEPPQNAVRAVVVDANIFGKGLPNLAVLESVASRLANKDIETIIPEPVAWEWAEHLAVEVENYRIIAQSAQNTLGQAKLSQGRFSLSYSDKATTIAAFLEALGALESVAVLPLSGESARAGLRDQILQTGAGSRKSDVKTGASDSAWLRDALAYVDGQTEALIILTKNRRDVLKYCKSLGIRTPTMYGSTGELPMSLFTFVTAAEDIGALVTKYLLDRLPSSYLDHEHGAVDQERLEFGSLSPDPAVFDGRGQEVYVSDIELRHVTDLITVTDVDIEIGDDEEVFRTASCTAWFLADVNVAVYSLDNDGQVVMDSWQFDQSLITAPLFIEFERDEITSVTSADEAQVHLDDGEHEFIEAIDALTELQQSFELIYGVKFPEDWLGGSDLDVSILANGRALEFRFSGDRWDEWTINISVAGMRRAEVACMRYDTAYSRVLSENMPMSGPYAVYSTVDGVQLPGVYPAVARITRALYGGAPLLSEDAS